MGPPEIVVRERLDPLRAVAQVCEARRPTAVHQIVLGHQHLDRRERAERLRQVGEWADKGQDIVRFVSTQSLEIQTRIPASVLPFLQHDQQVMFEAAGKAGSARVKQIVPVGDDRSRLYELRLIPENGSWYAGQTAKVAIPTARADSVIAIPGDALILRREGIRVFRIKPDNSAEPVTVETGIAAGGWIQVSGKIQPGDKVVTRGGERLRPGMKVSILPASAPP